MLFSNLKFIILIFSSFQYFLRCLKFSRFSWKKVTSGSNLWRIGQFVYSIIRNSPGHRYLLLHMNYSEKSSRTNSNVRFHELLESAMWKVIKMFDASSEQILPAPQLLLRWNTYSTVIWPLARIFAPIFRTFNSIIRTSPWCRNAEIYDCI